MDIKIKKLPKSEVEISVVLEDKDLKADLDTQITVDLKKEGQARELIRQIQSARKKAHCKLNQLVTAYAPFWPREYEGEIKKKTLLKFLKKGKTIKVVNENLK